MSLHTLIIDRKQLANARWLPSASPALQPGEVRLQVDRFALTANNITYAAFGDAMNYWAFFPSAEAGTGIIPVWGFATVSESRCEGVAVGERFYGYLPIASELVVQPTRLSDAGFTDAVAHRQPLHAVYNQYLRCSADPAYVKEREAQQALLRPLFITSFLIDDFLADNAMFGAQAVVMSSASSKTAYGTAFCLSQRRDTPGARQVIGLTSPDHLGFVRGLGCYDQVWSYDQWAEVSATAPTVYVDFSGNVNLRRHLHQHLGDTLKHSCSVGGTHWQDLGSGKGLPGPPPTLFFAPAQIKKRLADWGPHGLQQRTHAAWQAFMAPVTNGNQPWLQVREVSGQAAVLAAYHEVLSGQLPPQQGLMARP
jgi:hypothetical protein